MPVYEYRCQDCGAVTEFFLKNRQEAADVHCQQCGSGRLKRTFLTSIAPIRAGTKHEGIPCCGSQEGCSDPKRCCQR